MIFSDLLRMAFMNLWRRKLRAVLTVLGMVIGVSSIVVMMSLGVGIRKATMESYENMGSLTNITVSSWRWVENPNGGGSSTETKLDKKAVETMRQIPGVSAVMPQINAYGILKSGKWVADTSILAIDGEVAEQFGIELSEGRYPQYKRGGSTHEIVLSESVLNWFYDPNTGKQAVDRDGNPKVTMDSRFQLTFDYNSAFGSRNTEPGYVPGKTYRINAVGKVSPDNNEFSWYCLMDIEALQKLAKENEKFISLDTSSYNSVLVKCDSTDSVASVKETIDAMGYGTSSLQDSLEQAEQQMQQIQYLLGAIGGVSLLVAAIGIMNTMMMSIYERTREIGIIKVLGCRMDNIAELFLTEAAFIGLIGGALGLGISYGLAAIINRFIGSSGFNALIPLWLALGALIFSIAVALVSGLYPAIRAMRLSPLTAIRNE
ncbi:MAG: ABC transporter permease [Clostridia bacterium]|nr:ABC transporter permease [Clostridia bacterium]